jgi:hypothetical protein
VAKPNEAAWTMPGGFARVDAQPVANSTWSIEISWITRGVLRRRWTRVKWHR